MDWKKCKYRKWSHLYREMRTQSGRGHFSSSVRERQAARRSGMGPSLQVRRHSRIRVHQELNTRDCSAFGGQAALFFNLCTGYVQIWVLFWLLPERRLQNQRGGEATISIHCLFAAPASTPLPGRQPQHCSSLGHVISHAGQVKYFTQSS